MLFSTIPQPISSIISWNPFFSISELEKSTMCINYTLQIANASYTNHQL